MGRESIGIGSGKQGFLNQSGCRWAILTSHPVSSFQPWGWEESRQWLFSFLTVAFTLELRSHWPLGGTTGRKLCCSLDVTKRLLVLESIRIIPNDCYKFSGMLGDSVRCNRGLPLPPASPKYWSCSTRVIQGPVRSCLPSRVQCGNMEDKQTGLSSTWMQPHYKWGNWGWGSGEGHECLSHAYSVLGTELGDRYFLIVPAPF